MGPLGLLGIAAAGGVAYYLYQKNKEYVAPGQAPGQMPGIVSELTQGRSYTVLAVVTKDIEKDPRWSDGLGNLSPQDKVKSLLGATFALAGFKMLSQPTIRNADELGKMNAGEPSTWVFNAQWLRTEKFVNQTPSWLAGATFVLLPIQ